MSGEAAHAVVKIAGGLVLHIKTSLEFFLTLRPSLWDLTFFLFCFIINT